MSLICMVIVAGLIVCCSTAIAQDQDKLREIWQKKMPKETESFYVSLFSRDTKSYTCSVENKILVNGKMRTFNTRRLLKRKEPFWLTCDVGDADNPIDDVNNNSCYGFNSKYAFMLEGAKKSNNWIIRNITDVSPGLDETALFGERVGVPGGGKGYRAVVNSAFILYDIFNVYVVLFSGTRVVKTSEGNTVEFARRTFMRPPWKIGEIPGFRLRSIAAEGSHQNILRADFDYEYDASDFATAKDKGKKIGIVNCQMDFDLEAKCYPIKAHYVSRSGEAETILDWSRDLTKIKENGNRSADFYTFVHYFNSKGG